MSIQHNLDGGRRRAPAIAERPPARVVSARSLAHQLGNLLQVVNGNLELLCARVQDEQSLRYLANAQSAARELTALTRALADEA